MQKTIDTVKLAFLAKPDVAIPNPIAYVRIRPGVKLSRDARPEKPRAESLPPNPPSVPPCKKILPFWKRALDILILISVCPAVLVVGLVVALVIKFGSPGPVLYFQQRIGYQGRRFRFYKFRTMRVAAKSDSHRNHTRELINAELPMTKLDAQNDPRIIPFGAVLRACGLDELPQLINVLMGDMTIVGPRPCLPYEYELYTPDQLRRFEAVPGLTGLWQVNGKNHTTFARMIELDIQYLEQSSLWLDLRIIARTPLVLWEQFKEMRRYKLSGMEPLRPRDPFLPVADHL